MSCFFMSVFRLVEIVVLDQIIVVKFFDGGEEKYYGYLTNDYMEIEA
ncbi:MAG: hypothetical protein U9Q37_00060 [Euryarchaeota archaeon]|nr:hypothetical protein [Euryarchaeota archaeon]